jgi:hypothetical protein
MLEKEVAAPGFSLNPAAQDAVVFSVWNVMKAPCRYPSTEYAFASQACIAAVGLETVDPLFTTRPFVTHVKRPAYAPVGPVPEEFERSCMVEGR